MGRSELYNTCATALAALVLVAVWWSRHHGASTREVRSHSEQQTAGDREDKKAMEKKEKSERKEAKYARTRAAAEQRVNELTSRLNAARSSLSPQAAPLVLGAVDVEAWEGNSKLITEIGLAFFVVEGARSTFRHRHIIVQEHLTLRNGTFVEDNRDGFLFGDSEALPLVQAVEQVSRELNTANYIIGHAVHGDLKWLRSIGVSPEDTTQAPSLRSIEERVVDTQVLAVGCAERAAREGGANTDSLPAVQQRSLKALVHEYGLSPAALHNGGNDAAFTLQVMLSQCRVPFLAPPRTPSRHMLQIDFQEKQAMATAAAGVLNDIISAVEDAERPPEHRALLEQVAQFAQVLANGNAVIHPQVGVPELRFPPTLSAFERKLVHEAAASRALTSASQGTGAERYIAVRAGGASFPTDATKFSRKRAGKEAVNGGGKVSKRRGLKGIGQRTEDGSGAPQ